MLYIIVNQTAQSGKGKSIAKRLQEMLKAKGISYEWWETKQAGDAAYFARKFSALPGRKTIVTIGGDGTVNEALNGLILKRDLRFFHLPAGSGNDYAKGLGIPADAVKALSYFLRCDGVKRYDVGRLELFDGKVPVRFGVSAGIGYDASVCREVNQSPLKRRLNRLGLGKLAYFAIAIKQVFANAPQDMEVIADGKRKKLRNVNLLVMMNHRYEGGGLRMAPAADAADGKLTVVLGCGLSPWGVLARLPLLATGLHVYSRGVYQFHCRTLELRTEHPLPVHTDGEYIGSVCHLKAGLYEGALAMPYQEANITKK